MHIFHFSVHNFCQNLAICDALMIIYILCYLCSSNLFPRNCPSLIIIINVFSRTSLDYSIRKWTSADARFTCAMNCQGDTSYINNITSQRFSFASGGHLKKLISYKVRRSMLYSVLSVEKPYVNACI